MATLFPAQKQTMDSPTGADNLDSPDHAINFNRVADTSEAVQDVIGTTLGTNVLKNFTAGDHAARVSNTSVIQETWSGGTIDNTTIGTSAITGGTIIIDNNVAYRAKQAGGTTKDVMKLGTDDILRLSQIRYQTDDSNSIANSTKENIIEQFGWGQMIGADAVIMNETVTFPTTFGTILAVTTTSLGINTGSAAASITNYTTEGDVVTGVYNLATTGFTISLYRTTSTNMTSSNYYGYTWLAKGTKA